jgi:hypothetical protein
MADQAPASKALPGRERGGRKGGGRAQGGGEGWSREWVGRGSALEDALLRVPLGAIDGVVPRLHGGDEGDPVEPAIRNNCTII